MMQVLLQEELGDKFQVESAGLRKESVGKPASHNSVLCMQDIGVDISGHVSRWVGELNLSHYSHIVCVGDSEAEQVGQLMGGASRSKILVANKADGGVPNPHGKDLLAYRECLALLRKEMPKIGNTIVV
jgi:protein-tyrosine-phosphatase